MAKNNATIKASSTKVKQGQQGHLHLQARRPDSKDTIRGLPVALQGAKVAASNFVEA